jgi:hypothetical protein
MTNIKTQLVSFILILISAIAFGQPSKQYISLTVGPSFPINSYKNTDLNDSTSGWAKTGIALEFTYAYRLTHNIGAIVQGTYSSNKFDIFAYSDALTAAYSLDPNTPDTAFVTESAKNWSAGGLLAGPYLRFPFTEYLSWDIMATVGFYGVGAPNLTVKGNISNGDKLENYYMNGGKGYAFAYSFGTGFKYALSNYYLMVYAHYYNTSVKIKDVGGWDWNAQPYETSFKQDISYVSLTFGVGYFF